MRDVLVTGATGVIGTAIARALVGAGIHVWLAGRDRAKLESLCATLGAATALEPANLDDVAQAGRLVDDFAARAKTPHGLVCNAGNLGTPGAFATLDFAAFQASFNANFFSHAVMIQRFVRALGGRPGHVVVMSGAGLGGSRSFANVSSYSTAKAALTHFVEALSGEAPHISFNAVAPGAVVSAITDQAIGAGRSVLGAFAEDAEQQKAKGGVPASLAANLITWLMSHDAPVITGRLLAARFDSDWLKTNAQTLDVDRFRLRRIDGTLFGAVKNEKVKT